MSQLYYTAKEEVEKFIKEDNESVKQMALERVNARIAGGEVIEEKYMQMSLDGEFRSIKSEYVNERYQELIEKQFKPLLETFSMTGSYNVVDSMLNVLDREHRATQQEFWNSMYHLAKKYTNMNEDKFNGHSSHFDGRNQGAKRVTELMVKGIETL